MTAAAACANVLAPSIAQRRVVPTSAEAVPTVTRPIQRPGAPEPGGFSWTGL